MKVKRAWLIRWDDLADERDGVVPGRVVSFLDARLSDENVERVMKALWVSHSRLLWSEHLNFAVSPNRAASGFVRKHDSRIYVGVRPRLEARIVTDIDAADDDSGGTVSWTEFLPTGEMLFRQEKLSYRV